MNMFRAFMELDDIGESFSDAQLTEANLLKAFRNRARKVKSADHGLKPAKDLSTHLNDISVVDLVKGAYESGVFEQLPVGRENAVMLDIYGVDKERLTSYFRNQPEFAYELNNGSSIISHEFTSDKYDVEVFDGFIQMYRIPQSESVKESESAIKALNNSINETVNISKETNQMSNFVNIFEELNRLYEEDDVRPEAEADVEFVDDSTADADEPADFDADAVDQQDDAIAEPTQVVLECSNCGALAIDDVDNVETDDDTGLVNVDEKCKFCDEADGFKVIGNFIPSDSVIGGDDDEVDIEVTDDEAADDELDEGIFDHFKKNNATNKPVEEPNEEPAKEDEPAFTTYTYDEWQRADDLAFKYYQDGSQGCRMELWNKIIEMSACENLYKDIVAMYDFMRDNPDQAANGKDFAKHLEEELEEGIFDGLKRQKALSAVEKIFGARDLRSIVVEPAKKFYYCVWVSTPCDTTFSDYEQRDRARRADKWIEDHLLNQHYSRFGFLTTCYKDLEKVCGRYSGEPSEALLEFATFIDNLDKLSKKSPDAVTLVVEAFKDQVKKHMYTA